MKHLTITTLLAALLATTLTACQSPGPQPIQPVAPTAGPGEAWQYDNTFGQGIQTSSVENPGQTQPAHTDGLPTTDPLASSRR